MLFSTATHSSDASHIRANLTRGFPVIAEKRYALTPGSAQATRPGPAGAKVRASLGGRGRAAAPDRS